MAACGKQRVRNGSWPHPQSWAPRLLPLTSTCFSSLRSAVGLRRAEGGKGSVVLTGKKPLMCCLEEMGMHLRVTGELLEGVLEGDSGGLGRGSGWRTMLLGVTDTEAVCSESPAASGTQRHPFRSAY